MKLSFTKFIYGSHYFSARADLKGLREGLETPPHSNGTNLNNKMMKNNAMARFFSGIHLDTSTTEVLFEKQDGPRKPYNYGVN